MKISRLILNEVLTVLVSLYVLDSTYDWHVWPDWMKNATAIAAIVGSGVMAIMLTILWFQGVERWTGD